MLRQTLSMGLKQSGGKGSGKSRHWTTEASPFFSVDVERAVAEVPLSKALPEGAAAAGPTKPPRLKGGWERQQRQPAGLTPPAPPAGQASHV